MKLGNLSVRSSWQIGLCVLLGLLNTPTAHASLLEVVNELRNGGCQSRTKLAPLQTDARLQSVVKRVADGALVDQAARSAAYPATHLSTIHLSGYRREPEAQQLLVKNYCKLVMNPDWMQMSSEWRGDELWIVLAALHAIPGNQAATAQQVLALVNAARSTARRCGRERFIATHALRLNSTLNKAALRHAEDMATHSRMEHEGSDGSTPAQRITRQGYHWKAVGENVAAGAGTAEEVVAGWLDSPGHCANIMSPQFTEMGVGFAVNMRDEQAVYWAQSFGTPRP
jgi:uncharacterized protein YkwD